MDKERFKIPFAAHLFLIRGNSILLYLRKGGTFNNMHSVIAGHVDKGETATQAIIREAEEEAGIKIEPSDINFACFSHSYAGYKEFAQIFFYCTKWKGEIKNLEKNRCTELKFFNIEKLPSNIVPYIKKSINCFQEKLGYFEFDWDKCTLQRRKENE